MIYNVDRNNIIAQLQTALNTIVTETSTHGFLFAPEKSTATWFTVPIQTLNCNSTTATSTGQTAPGIWELILTGNMHSHVVHTLNSVSRSLNTLKVMPFLSGVNRKILLRIFNACTRACLNYGAECFNILSLTQTRQNQRKQNTDLKFVLGVNKMGANLEHSR